MKSNKSALVLMHGHGVDASIWDGIYADLASVATVLKPDFSGLSTHVTIEAYAEELYGRLQSAQVENVVLVGHSMGGYIALAFADKYPEMMHALVLYHSTALADDANRREVRRQAVEGLKKEGTVPFIQKQMPKMVALAYPAEKTQELIDRFINLPTSALIAGLEAMAARPDRTQVLRTAQFPILLVLGREDQVIPYEMALQLTQLSDQISVATIEQAGHLSMVEQPDTSINVLQSFIDKL